MSTTSIFTFIVFVVKKRNSPIFLEDALGGIKKCRSRLNLLLHFLLCCFIFSEIKQLLLVIFPIRSEHAPRFLKLHVHSETGG